MTLTQIQYALAVEKFKNFNLAAKNSHVSQPTLSMQLKKLEDEIGHSLFDRSKNPILTTDEGKLFIEQARIVFFEFRRLEELSLLSDEIKGELRIGIIPTLAPYLTPLFLIPFSKRYPKVKLILEEWQTDEIIQKLLRDELDGGLMATPLKDNRLIEKNLFYEKFYLYLSPQMDWPKNKSIDPHELEKLDVWLLEEGHCLRTQVLRLCSFSKSKKNVEFSGGNLETLIRLVDQGEGVTVVPELALSGLNRDRIREFKNIIPTREVGLVSARSFYKEKLLDALEETIVEGLPVEVSSPKKKSFKILKPV